MFRNSRSANGGNSRYDQVAAFYQSQGGETMWGALRSLALRIGNNEDFRELIKGVAMAFGWLIVSAIVVLIAAIIVSALF
jgi:hypothetical protein